MAKSKKVKVKLQSVYRDGGTKVYEDKEGKKYYEHYEDHKIYDNFARYSGTNLLNVELEVVKEF